MFVCHLRCVLALHRRYLQRRDNRGMSAPKHRPPPRPTRPAANLQPLSERELDELQAIIDRVPAPLEPLDVSMIDGFLCGVLVQPNGVPPQRWLPHITDADGRALPPAFDTRRLFDLIERRYLELGDAIGRRQWFDPWVFELGDAGEGGAPDEDDRDDDDDLAPPEVDAVYPWVAGFATAVELFPALMRLDAKALTEPLALLYRHLGPDDLEDADDLLEEIDSLEPPADLTEAVEGLVRATLLLADVSRPLGAPAGQHRGGAPRRPTPRRH